MHLKKNSADICSVLYIDLPRFKISKGFLAQAKIERYGLLVDDIYNKLIVYNNTELKKLKNQTDKMLNITPDSFVIVYSMKKFLVVPASTIKGLNILYDEGNIMSDRLSSSIKLYGKPIDQFFKEFITCFVGDLRLNAYDDKTLIRLKEETLARSVIMFHIYKER